MTKKYAVLFSFFNALFGCIKYKKQQDIVFYGFMDFNNHNSHHTGCGNGTLDPTLKAAILAFTYIFISYIQHCILTTGDALVALRSKRHGVLSSSWPKEVPCGV